MKLKRIFAGIIPLAMAALLFPPSPAEAGPSAAAMDFGYQKYLRFHPPQDKPLKLNLYPYGGPIIPTGSDIPVCAAAHTAEAYAKKRDLRYVTHGLDGWLFRTIDFRTDFAAAPQTIKYFTRLNSTLAAHGQTLIVAIQPPRAMVSAKHIDPAGKPKGYAPEKAHEGYEAFLKQIQQAGIRTVDLSNVAPDITYFAKGDFHWAPAGSGDSAKKVAAALQDIPAYAHIDKQDFISEISGIDAAERGALEEFIQQTCQINLELTTKPVWATHAKETGASAAKSLLGDTAFPAMTVVGTSNSAEDDKFNFVGALKQYSHADIYNAALTGGGFSSSSYRYYASDEYHAHPPKIIIWEFLPQHNYNNTESMNGFRQMIPAVYGACSKEDALAEYSGDIKQTQTEFFSRIRNISLKDTYLFLDVKDPLERDLRVEILYSNGDADQTELTRSTRIKNNGKYYLELGNDVDTNALFFHLITDKPQGHVTARLCHYPTKIVGK
jgi:alginate biosynthesis protein AlgX